jgi:hypothetical protein
LRAEADTQHRQISLQGIFDHFHFSYQVSKPTIFVNTHGAAKHHETVISVQARVRIRMTSEVDVTDAKAGPLKQWV